MSETIQIYWHPDCLGHDTGLGCYDLEASPLIEIPEPHPETPERLVNIKSILERGPLRNRIEWKNGNSAQRGDLLAFVDRDYLDSVYAAADRVASEGAALRFDGATTVVSEGTLKAVQAAAGCALDAVGAILDGQTKVAYALIRPPGHHASRKMADGYCLVNNIGVAVERALSRGVKRIAVLDWDVHHGNGTQAGFYDRADVLTISLHMPLGSWGENHPELGTVDEVGEGPGKGRNLNIPLPYGSGDQAYAMAVERIVQPVLEDFDPELLVIANGLDANQFDLNGRNLLSMAGFRELGQFAKTIADKHCDGRLLLVQEGGYAATYTAFCAYAVLEGVLGVTEPMRDPIAYPASIEQVGDLSVHLSAIMDGWETASGQRIFSQEPGG